MTDVSGKGIVSREEFERRVGAIEREFQVGPGTHVGRIPALERGKTVQDFAIAALRWGVPITLTLIGIVAMIWIGTR